MKKIFLLLSISTLFLFSETAIKKVSEDKSEITLKKSYLQDLKTKINKEWSTFVKESGKTNLKLIINTKKGVIEKVIIIDKAGNKIFVKEFKIFLQNLRNISLRSLKTKTGIIDINIELRNKKSNNLITKDSVSIYKDRSNIIYNEYLQYLRENRNYSNKQIKKILDSDKKTVSKMMLLAIYYDYNKNNIEEARKYYNIVINSKIDRFKNNTEGLFLADFLIREGRDDLVLELLPKFSCEYMQKRKKYECFYYRAKALYRLNDPEYEFPLNLAKSKIRKANLFYKNIRGK